MGKERDIFLWGAASSSHQVEGDNRLNDWCEWESLGRVKEPSGLACDHYRRFRDDFQIAKDLGHTSHRLSLEWSRLEPEEGVWDMTEWAHYQEVVDALRSLGMEPLLTLNHFTLPLWLYRKGGWSYPGSVGAFETFARMAVEKLGNIVTFWITVNEPLVHAFMGYVRGVWPPGRTDFRESLVVIANQIRAHARAYPAMKLAARDRFSRDIRIGVAHNVERFLPRSSFSPADLFAVSLRHRFYNHLFVWSLQSGWIIFPGFRVERVGAGRALDFIGINFYTCGYVRFAGLKAPAVFGTLSDPPGRAPEWRNSLGWRVCPQGAYVVLKDFSRYRLPIMVTENGFCTQDDAERSRFIREHLSWIFRARREGVPLAGYYYWSLLDNFEWAEGYGPRFGIVEVDYASQKRTLRPSAHVLSERMTSELAGEDY